MGEAKRREELGYGIRPLRPGDQIQVDMKNAVRRRCECGCEYFIAVAEVYIISALVSPTGQELIAQQPVLACMDCKRILKKETKGLNPDPAKPII